MMIPTEVTMLNIHAAASTAAFLSALLDGGIFSIVDPASNFLFVLSQIFFFLKKYIRF
ncbi:hypothetical protein HanXRQr2_Chr11g0466581 [Helianthus annuus]|uniref:Uncharacterized protein n=1 Tax=Helianthus annuus TaxID=4232 RepID=A0A9K3HKG9_HELAN|nr:hypothetical protein HanXRQr2_Chr11g0466581 [Helianthus annuus]